MLTILSIMLHSLQTQAHSKFTLVYGNKNMASVMFNETLQDLKDRYPDRVTLVHVLSRQSQEADLLEGRIDTAKVQRLLASLLPAKSMDEVFVCGPEGMIETTCQALMDAGVTANRVHAERFASASTPATPRQANTASKHTEPAVALTLVLDGKTHHLRMNADERILDVALSAGLDLPHSCKGGVCCTCRAKVTQGSVAMEKNFTLEAWETAQGFVLSCQSKPTSAAVTLSFDER
jgi:ring-1,2-phenylacetyl-CoA epoxidase subunit PaaE